MDIHHRLSRSQRLAEMNQLRPVDPNSDGKQAGEITLVETEKIVRLGLPKIIRLKENAPELDYSSFYGTTGTTDGCLVVPDLTPLLTKIRTLIHEKISLSWRTLFPLSSNDPCDECLAAAQEAGILLVGVRCPLEAVEERERTRENLRNGLARSQF